TASLAISLAFTELGTVIAQDAVPASATAAELLPLLALTFWCFGAGLFVAQLTTVRRVASLTAGIVILALFTLNSSLRAGADPADLGPARWLSPFYLFDRSAPLLAGGSVDALAVVVSLAVAGLLVAVSVWAFLRRDVGSALIRGQMPSGRPRWRPSSDPLLRLPVP